MRYLNKDKSKWFVKHGNCPLCNSHNQPELHLNDTCFTVKCSHCGLETMPHGTASRAWAQWDEASENWDYVREDVEV